MALKRWPAGKSATKQRDGHRFPAGHVTQNATTYEQIATEKVQEGEQNAPRPCTHGQGVDNVNTSLAGQLRVERSSSARKGQLSDEDPGSQVCLGHVVNTTRNHE